MSMYIAHGGKDTVITTEEKTRTYCTRHSSSWEVSRRKSLVIPPDITRLHSNAGELTRILYELWGR